VRRPGPTRTSFCSSGLVTDLPFRLHAHLSSCRSSALSQVQRTRPPATSEEPYKKTCPQIASWVKMGGCSPSSSLGSCSLMVSWPKALLTLGPHLLHQKGPKRILGSSQLDAFPHRGLSVPILPALPLASWDSLAWPAACKTKPLSAVSPDAHSVTSYVALLVLCSSPSCVDICTCSGSPSLGPPGLLLVFQQGSSHCLRLVSPDEGNLAFLHYGSSSPWMPCLYLCLSFRLCPGSIYPPP
jgi:hypothetical protein